MLIDQRTFSWTEFFNRIEETLPADVMLTEVQPSFQEDKTIISMTALGRRTEDVDEFIEKLEATGSFEQVLPKQIDQTDEGLTRVLITAVYRGASVVRAIRKAGAARRAGRTMTDVRRIVAEHRRAVWLIAGALILNAALLALVVLPLSQKVRGGEEAGAGGDGRTPRGTARSRRRQGNGDRQEPG